MLLLNTEKNIASEKSKSIKTELRRIKNKAKKMLVTWRRTIWKINEEKQVKNLLAKLREDERIVLYANQIVTNTLIKKFLKISLSYIPSPLTQVEK